MEREICLFALKNRPCSDFHTAVSDFEQTCRLRRNGRYLCTMTEATIIAQTAHWVRTVVVGFNFCPFAAKPLLRNGIRYAVYPGATAETALTAMAEELQRLNQEEETETTLMIFPDSFGDFHAYLDMVEMAETLNHDLGYDGTYQVASFHPQYRFARSREDDPANYTNRSPYPMLHLIREESINRIADTYPNLEGIPDRNIALAREKGLPHMQMLLAACMQVG